MTAEKADSESFSKPVLLMIPGIGLDDFVYGELEALLEDIFDCRHISYSSLLFSARGNASNRAFSVEQTAGLVAGLCDARGWKRAWVLGHSLGGFITLALARQYPSLVEGGIVLASTHRFITSANMKTRLTPGTRREDLVSLSIANSVSPSFITQSRKRYEELVEHQRQYPPSARMIRAQIKGVHPFDMTDEVSEITQPFGFVTGDRDKLVHPHESESTARMLRNGSFYAIENCGHLPQYECPEKTASIVKAFVPF